MAVCKWEYNVHFPGGCQGFATSSTHPRRARVKTCLCRVMRWRDNKGFKVTHPKQIWSRLFGSPLAFSSGDPRKLAQAREKTELSHALPQQSSFRNISGFCEFLFKQPPDIAHVFWKKRPDFICIFSFLNLFFLAIGVSCYFLESPSQGRFCSTICIFLSCSSNRNQRNHLGSLKPCLTWQRSWNAGWQDGKVKPLYS